MDAATHATRSRERDCFLCEPSHDLVFLDREGFVALAGLGPVVYGYSLIAAKAHVRSMADIPAEAQSERDSFVNTVRERLSNKYGRCLITEHGRMRVCIDDSDGLDAHCLHAHFLLFPGAGNICEIARSYFGNMETFDGLATALAQARHYEEYLLVSPTPDEVTIFSKPLNVPRQLARYLVAHESNTMHLADWRSHPNREHARSIAGEIRPLFEEARAAHG
jgi:diadenosine tetraphosphate (Ap4A) HIT family hydrolase